MDKSADKESPYKIVQPYKMFCKSELNNQDIKLVFLDNSVITPKFLSTQNIEKFKTQHLLPVVSHFLLMEMIAGLDRKYPKYPQHIKNKREFTKFLDSIGALFMMDHSYILSKELNRVDSITNAHESVKVFATCPLGFHLLPFEPGCTYDSWLDNVLKNFPSIIEEFCEGKRANYNADAFCKAQLATMDQKERLIFQDTLNSKHIEMHTGEADKKKELTIFNAPYFTVENIFYQQRVIEPILSQKNEKIGKEGNHFIDSVHATSALSYCDFFCTDDIELQINCNKVIKDIDLNVKVIDLNLELVLKKAIC